MTAVSSWGGRNCCSRDNTHTPAVHQYMGIPFLDEIPGAGAPRLWIRAVTAQYCQSHAIPPTLLPHRTRAPRLAGIAFGHPANGSPHLSQIYRDGAARLPAIVIPVEIGKPHRGAVHVEFDDKAFVSVLIDPPHLGKMIGLFLLGSLVSVTLPLIHHHFGGGGSYFRIEEPPDGIVQGALREPAHAVVIQRGVHVFIVEINCTARRSR